MSKPPRSRSPAPPREASEPSVSEPVVGEPDLNATGLRMGDDLREHAITQICKVYETFGQALQMMCSLDHSFAIRLTACRTVGEATLLCGEWMAHRVDSLFGVQSQLTEIWIEYANAVVLRRLVAQQESEIKLPDG